MRDQRPEVHEAGLAHPSKIVDEMLKGALRAFLTFVDTQEASVFEAQAPEEALRHPDSQELVEGPLHGRVRAAMSKWTDVPAGRRYFEACLARRETHGAGIRATLLRYGLPPELEALALVESGFEPASRSWAGARGLWQLMPETARAYGLQVGRRQDDRLDIERSTEAAAQHLRYLHDRLGRWDLTLAAYNVGLARVIQSKKSTGARSVWALTNRDTSFSSSTSEYVARILAAMRILEAPERYGFDAVHPDDASAIDTAAAAKTSAPDALEPVVSNPAGAFASFDPPLCRLDEARATH